MMGRRNHREGGQQTRPNHTSPQDALPCHKKEGIVVIYHVFGLFFHRYVRLSSVAPANMLNIYSSPQEKGAKGEKKRK
jgi:hypothetical protein